MEGYHPLEKIDVDESANKTAVDGLVRKPSQIGAQSLAGGSFFAFDRIANSEKDVNK